MAATCNKLGPLHTVTEKSLTEIAGSEAQIPKIEQFKVRPITEYNNNILLEMRKSQDLAKDFWRTARSWKGSKTNKATGKKIYKFKKLNLWKELYN